jgi:hypothetical protein
MGSDQHELERTGYQVVDSFLDKEACGALLESIAKFRQSHDLPEIHRPARGRELRYQVIDGKQIQAELPTIWDLYTGKVNRLIDRSAPERLVPLENVRAGVNINIMQPGQSSYRWHYDRTSVTSILYLNDVEGGETELYPNYRIRLKNRGSMRLQHALDSVIQIRLLRDTFSEMVRIPPKAGRLVTMRGDRCWHSVRSVTGDRERINVILAYDTPGAAFPAEEGLDSYLYTQEEQRSADPNYG